MSAIVFVAATVGGGIAEILKPLGITNIDPWALTVIGGLVWPWVQAIFDKPWWTPGRRFALAVVGAVVLSVLIWYAGHYPITWKQIVTQAMMGFGILTISFRALKAAGVIDWVGRVTPGGEPYVGRHRKESQ